MPNHVITQVGVVFKVVFNLSISDRRQQPITNGNDIDVVRQDTPHPLQKDNTPRSSMCVPCCSRKRRDSGSDETLDSSSSDEDMFQARGIGGTAQKRKRKRRVHPSETTTDFQQAELKTYFKNAGFDGDPEKVAYLSYKPDLGNTKWVCCYVGVGHNGIILN